MTDILPQTFILNSYHFIRENDLAKVRISTINYAGLCKLAYVEEQLLSYSVGDGKLWSKTIVSFMGFIESLNCHPIPMLIMFPGEHVDLVILVSSECCTILTRFQRKKTTKCQTIISWEKANNTLTTIIQMWPVMP